jgi:hypothetical protein
LQRGSRTFSCLERRSCLQGKRLPRALCSQLTFASETTDGRYLHAFRVYYDTDSGCVRFEATARRGPLNTIPIWTAFVTPYVGRGDWMKRVGPDTIQFEKLHPYVFSDSYRLPKGSTGKYRLSFTSSEGILSSFSLYVIDTETWTRCETVQRKLLSHQTPISSA